MQKTPYELDLETMDRIPDVTPKVGDYVKIKSLEWYQKWKDGDGNVEVPWSFTGTMQYLCGRFYQISSIDEQDIIHLQGLIFAFSKEMFEEIFSANQCGMTCIGADTSAEANLPSWYTSRLSSDELVVTPKELESMKNMIRDRWSVTLQGKNLEESLSDFTKRKEPELQTIKKHRFIKLNKL